MTTVAVVANVRKTVGGGLDELRKVLAEEGVHDPPWLEVTKSKQAPKRLRPALDDGVDLLFVWGGDGMVRRCIDELAGSRTTIAIIPAGTANLLATNLGVPGDIAEAVRIGLHGGRRSIDVGLMNGDRFAVMGGTGFDALLIRDAETGVKEAIGRAGYIWSGAKHLGDDSFDVKVRVDQADWFTGEASCVLVANVGTVLGGLTLFQDARPDDGRLEIGIVTARGLLDWGRTLGRTVMSGPEGSPFVHLSSGQTFDVRLDRKRPYEIDGGDRKPTKRLRISTEPGAITLAVPDRRPASEAR